MPGGYNYWVLSEASINLDKTKEKKYIASKQKS